MNASAREQQHAMCRLICLLVLLALPVFALLGAATAASAQSISTGDGAWVWQNPLPQGNSLHAVWGADTNNVWAVGRGGKILWRHTHRLLVTSSGSGSGIVRRTQPGTPCGNNCSEYGQGVGVTLTPAAYPGSNFVGWSGDCSGAGQCSLTIDAAKQVTATFAGHSELVHLSQIAR